MSRFFFSIHSEYWEIAKDYYLLIITIVKFRRYNFHLIYILGERIKVNWEIYICGGQEGNFKNVPEVSFDTYIFERDNIRCADA